MNYEVILRQKKRLLNNKEGHSRHFKCCVPLKIESYSVSACEISAVNSSLTGYTLVSVACI